MFVHIFLIRLILIRIRIQKQLVYDVSVWNTAKTVMIRQLYVSQRSYVHGRPHAATDDAEVVLFFAVLLLWMLSEICLSSFFF